MGIIEKLVEMGLTIIAPVASEVCETATHSSVGTEVPAN
jgi:hypothetical protein